MLYNPFMTGVPAVQKLKQKLAENLIARGYLLGLDRRPLYCRSDFKSFECFASILWCCSYETSSNKYSR